MRKGREYNYLRPEGTIMYSIDRMYDAPETEIDFNGWYESTVRFWAKNSIMRWNFLRWKSTPVPSLSVSSLSYDSGFDTVYWKIEISYWYFISRHFVLALILF